jgi:lambda repressor-like predicted transcriptional regulator
VRQRGGPTLSGIWPRRGVVVQLACWPLEASLWPDRSRGRIVWRECVDRLVCSVFNGARAAPSSPSYDDAMGRTPRERPAELADEPWPDVASSDALAEVARQFVVRLRASMGNRSVRSICVQAGLHHQTLLNVLAGRVWPDLATIARLEMALDADLWPGRSLTG